MSFRRRSLGMAYRSIRLPFAFALALLWVAWALAAAPARAQSSDFNDGTDAGWSHYQPLAAYGAPGVYTFPNGGYRIQAAPSPQPGTLGPSRAGSLRPDAAYSSFSEAVDLVNFDPSHDQALGLLARVTNPGLGTMNGYVFTYSVGSREIDLTRATNERPTNLAKTPAGLDAGHAYRLVFRGEGALLSGQVFDLANPSPLPLASATALDATYGSGVGGLLVFDNTDARLGSFGADATFDNYAASALPEPGGVALLALSGCVIGPRRRGRAR